MAENVVKAEMDVQEKKNKSERMIYPLAELFGGIYKSYFSTYLGYLMTTVYIFSISVAGVMEIIGVIVGWVAAPVLGGVLDRFSFKKGKFWPWFLISGVGSGVLYFLIFSIPVVTATPQKFMLLAAVLIAIAGWTAATSGQVGLTIFMHLGKDAKMRAFMSMGVKFFRDGMKMVVGAIFPVALVFLTVRMSDVKAWALFATILVVIASAGFIWVANLTRKSSVERDALSGRVAIKKDRPITKTIAAILTNRALLIMFVALVGSKIFYFFHVMGASFFWRYYMNDFGMMAVYNFAFALAAIIGVLLVPAFLKIFKDNKICFVVSMFIQAGIYVISLFVVSPDSKIGTIAVIAAAAFFNGLSDGFVLPLFGVAAEYTVWKTGVKDYGLTMSTFSIAIRVGTVASTAIRTALLAAAGFSSKALSEGAVVPEAVKGVLRNYNTIIPLCIALGIALLVMFFNPMTDAKAEQYRKEVSEREAAQKS